MVLKQTTEPADRCGMTNDNDFLPGILLAEVQRRRKGAARTTTLDCAIDAAMAIERDDRGWALVALAARLRSDEAYQAGLDVLDAAIALDPSWEVQTAAFTTAAAIHCDLGDLNKARAICDQTLARGVTPYLLKAAARIYWELAQTTRLQEFYDRWKELSKTLESLQTDPAPVIRTS